MLSESNEQSYFQPYAEKPLHSGKYKHIVVDNVPHWRGVFSITTSRSKKCYKEMLTFINLTTFQTYLLYNLFTSCSKLKT